MPSHSFLFSSQMAKSLWGRGMWFRSPASSLVVSTHTWTLLTLWSFSPVGPQLIRNGCHCFLAAGPWNSFCVLLVLTMNILLVSVSTNCSANSLCLLEQRKRWATLPLPWMNNSWCRVAIIELSVAFFLVWDISMSVYLCLYLYLKYTLLLSYLCVVGDIHKLCLKGLPSFLLSEEQHNVEEGDVVLMSPPSSALLEMICSLLGTGKPLWVLSQTFCTGSVLRR